MSSRSAGSGDSPSDPELLRAIVAGDEDAFEVFVDRYEARIRRLLVSLVSEPAEAEDLAQETFLKVFRSAKKYRGEGSVKGWLFRIASRTGLDALRRRRARAETSLEPGMELASLATVETDFEAREGLERVWKGLSRLSESSRLALVLREVEGLSYREMAEVLECPLGTVLSRVHRARSELMSLLDTGDRTPRSRRWDGGEIR